MFHILKKGEENMIMIRKETDDIRDSNWTSTDGKNMYLKKYTGCN